MRTLWHKQGDLLHAQAAASLTPSDTDVVVRLQAQVVGRRDGGGRGAAGVGVVEAAGAEAQAHLGKRVLVPGTVPESDDRDAALVALVQPGVADDAVIASHLVCPARWTLPLEEGLELDTAVAALAARELVDAYALLIEANVIPRAPVIVCGTGATAELAARLARTRGSDALLLARPGSAATVVAELPAARRHERVHVLIATDDPELLDEATALLSRLRRPSVAVLASARAGGALDLATIGRSGGRFSGVVGGHPDLLAEAVALVVKGQLSLDGVAPCVAVDEPLVDDTRVVLLPA